MDFFDLLNQFEDLLKHSKRSPFTHQIMVDEDTINSLLDQIRVLLPEELKKAQEVLARKERILAQAQEEANRTINQARNMREQYIDQNDLVIQAQEKARLILEQANEEAKNFRTQSSEYAIGTLVILQQELQQLMEEAHNGINHIKEMDN